jgi:hypothetical protein
MEICLPVWRHIPYMSSVIAGQYVQVEGSRVPSPTSQWRLLAPWRALSVRGISQTYLRAEHIVSNRVSRLNPLYDLASEYVQVILVERGKKTLRKRPKAIKISKEIVVPLCPVNVISNAGSIMKKPNGRVISFLCYEVSNAFNTQEMRWQISTYRFASLKQWCTTKSFHNVELRWYTMSLLRSVSKLS